MRLIDADAFKEWLMKNSINERERDESRAIGIWIDVFPSAQPEIIRCKDCAKREYCRTSTVWAVAPPDDWFCADAERRDDG